MLEQLHTMSKKKLLKPYVLCALLIYASNSFAQSTNTSLGTDALAQSTGNKFTISHINITSPGTYSRPTVNLNLSATVEWVYQYMEVNMYGVYFDGEIRSTTALGSFFPTLIGGSGTGATLGASFNYESDGFYYYYIYANNSGSGYVPQVSISPIVSNYYAIESYINTNNQLEIYYDDYSNSNAYSTPPTVSISYGGAVAEAVLSQTAINGDNTAIGYQALMSNIGAQNSALGAHALKSNTSGTRNTANGFKALYSNTTGSGNIANGYQALYSNTTGGGNIANGYQALYSITTGYYNVANGYQALYSNTTGGGNIANGYLALYSNTTGYYNVANGYQALYSNTTGSNNLANGVSALNNNTTGYSNLAIGNYALSSNQVGFRNVAIGEGALSNNKDNYNTGVGYQALYFNTNGSLNTAIGYQTLFYNTTGVFNTGLGFQSLPKNTTGNENTSLGAYTLYSITTGANNVGIGANTGRDNISGSRNTFVGNNTGRGITNGTGNTILGAGNIALPANLSNTVIISDGDGNQRFYSPTSGNVIIGRGNNPNDDGFKLDVGGSGRFAGALTLVAEPIISASAYDLLTRNSVTGVVEKISGASFGSNYIGNNNSGDWQLASSSTLSSYNHASLELRESNFGLASATPPRLSFHWGGVVASQIGIENDGTLAIQNNPGTSYEKLKAAKVTVNDGYYVGNTNLTNGFLTITAGNGNGMGFWNASPQTYGIWMGDKGTYGQLTSDANNDYNMYFKMSSLNRGFQFIAGDGNICAEIKAGAFNLNGIIKAKAVKVDPNAWPDYVFEPHYKLLSLKSVEQYIKKEGHLPDIPSAAEVAKEGVELGELGASLLKKIEELTLYLIQKDKELAEANKRIDALSDKIKELKP